MDEDFKLNPFFRPPIIDIAMNLPVKYRPKTFEEVTGQRHVTKTLQNALRKGKISHAYLFAGPRGVGKTTTARILAKGLNCVHGPTPTPCNKCEVCREIDDGRSLDVIEIDGASNRGIDEIRNLREQVRFLPTKGRYRVFIIDEVHMLTTEAFNALLKTLEEPPEHVVFVLATTEPRKVPETVISRTQRFDFRPLSIEEIVNRLAEISRLEGIEADEAAFRAIAKYADGSLRDAVALLEQLAIFSENRITPHEVNMMLGIVEDEFFLELFQMLLDRNAQGALLHVDELFSQGYTAKDFVTGFQNACESLLKARLGLERNEFEQITSRLQPEDILGFLKAALNMEEAIRYSQQPRIWIEYHIVRLAFMPRTAEIQRFLDKSGFTILGSTSEPFTSKSEIKETAVYSAPTQEQSVFGLESEEKQKEAKTPPAPELESEDQNVLEQIFKKIFEWNPALAHVVKNSSEYSDGKLTITAQDDMAKDLIERDLERIRSSVSEVLGKEVKIELKTVSSDAHPLLEHPEIKKLIEQLNLEVVEDAELAKDGERYS